MRDKSAQILRLQAFFVFLIARLKAPSAPLLFRCSFWESFQVTYEALAGFDSLSVDTPDRLHRAVFLIAHIWGIIDVRIGPYSSLHLVPDTHTES